MAKSRSPNYPQATLSDAIENVRKVWKQETWGQADQEVVAQHLGYKSLNGAAQVALSALRKYGLLEGRGDALKVSKLAVTLLEGNKNSADYKQALREAANNPSLFAELAKLGSGGALPSEENVRFNLIGKGFNPKAAEKAARIFLETFRLLSPGDRVYTPDAGGGNGSDDGDQDQDEPNDDGADDRDKSRPPIPPGRRKMNPAEGMNEEVFTLPEGAAVLTWPGGLSAASYEELFDWLQLVLRKAKRTTSAPADPEKVPDKAS